MPVLDKNNPLYELLVWVVESTRHITLESVIDLIFHAPQYYDIWWRRLLKETPMHVLIETGLICFIVWLMFIRRTMDPVKAGKDEKFTEREVKELIDTWIPEPLVPTVLSENAKAIAGNMMVIESVKGNYLQIRGIQKPVLNLSSFDFLGLSRLEDTKDESRKALDKYGCGSCGPRGFYGTIDKHLEIEAAIANFMGTEEAISYSDGASTVSSAIPAFSKRGDLLLVDDACSEPILTGANLSRSTIQFFKHNDMKDLESILTSIAKDDRRLKRDATQQRRFIVVEAVNKNTGNLCPLPELLALKKKYCYRLILDESISFGTLGATGRGITEHFGISITDIEIVTVAMDTALASVGGLCIGTREIVDHQRLSGAGYCFSASAPPFLSAAAVAALNKLKRDPQIVADLTSNAKLLRARLSEIPEIEVTSQDPTPVIHFVLRNPSSKTEEAALILRLSDECIRLGVGIVSSKYAYSTTQAVKINLRPSLRICANATLTPSEVDTVIAGIRQALINLNLSEAAAPKGTSGKAASVAVAQSTPTIAAASTPAAVAPVAVQPVLSTPKKSAEPVAESPAPETPTNCIPM